MPLSLVDVRAHVPHFLAVSFGVSSVSMGWLLAHESRAPVDRRMAIEGSILASPGVAWVIAQIASDTLPDRRWTDGAGLTLLASMLVGLRFLAVVAVDWEEWTLRGVRLFPIVASGITWVLGACFAVTESAPF